MLALDKYLWTDSNHIDLKQLWNYLAQYLYLPRLKDEQVLLNAIEQAVYSTAWSDSFAYASGFDETKGRYLELKFGTGISPSISSQSLIVKPDIAQKQIDTETEAKEPPIPPVTPPTVPDKTPDDYIARPGATPPLPTPPKAPKRFFGTVEIDTTRIIKDTDSIAAEVIQHLISLHDAKVKVTLEIQADIPDGVPDTVIQTLNENCRTLRFKNQSFELE